MQTHGTANISVFLKSSFFPVPIFEKRGMKRKKKGSEQLHKYISFPYNAFNAFLISEKPDYIFLSE